MQIINIHTLCEALMSMLGKNKNRLEVDERAGQWRCTSVCSFVRECLPSQGLESSSGASPVGMWRESLLG